MSVSGQPLLHKVGFLRPTPASDVTVLDLNQRAGRAHAGVRLEWPFVLGLNHFRGGLEGVIDIPVFLFDAALAYAGFADVVVKRSLLGEGVRQPADHSTLSFCAA